ncbi:MULTISPECIES: DUF2064 domain-containing protein [unclassified Arthrobacter]|uniref:TIGR04282 family arsenosugar biosynthesis glycosyltransferase n=1 Tax=unclassified Arthrobacter TaxID=235627 RepID=UPI003390A93C
MILTIAVIAKECLPGKAKTRLTPPLTAAQAADLAQISLSQTLDAVRSFPAARRLLVFDGTPRRRDAAGFEAIAQSGGGLDERLAAICPLSDGPLLLLGMDTPQLSALHLAPLLADWSTAQPRHRAWFGPASDGGFWALGLHKPDGALVRGVTMSTDQTGRQQLDRLQAAGLDVGLLSVLTDVDTFADAQAVSGMCRGTPFSRATEQLAQHASAAALPGSQRPTAGPHLWADG